MTMACYRSSMTWHMDTLLKGAQAYAVSCSGPHAAASVASAAALAACGRVLEEHDWQLGDRQQHYGSNEMAIPVKSVAALIADEMWHPFYVFQYFSIIIWVAGDQYYTYAVCILVITWFSIITSAVETHQNMKRLADIAHFSCMVGVQLHGVPLVHCCWYCISIAWLAVAAAVALCSAGRFAYAQNLWTAPVLQTHQTVDVSLCRRLRCCVAAPSS